MFYSITVIANDDDECNDNMNTSIPSRLSCECLDSVGPVQPYLRSTATPLDYFMLMVAMISLIT